MGFFTDQSSWSIIITLIILIFCSHLSVAWPPSQSVKNTMESQVVLPVRYHSGPVVSSTIDVHIVWYGTWLGTHKEIIREFINSISNNSTQNRSPSVSDWWKIVQLYSDQTGSNVSRTVRLGKESNDHLMSQGRNLTHWTSFQSVIKTAIEAKTNPLPIDPKGGIYLLLLADDVDIEDFCGICGNHYFTYPSVVGYSLPFAWVGNGGKICPESCAFPFPGIPKLGIKPVKPPNGDVGVDGMISNIAVQIVNVVTNPFRNGWYEDFIGPNRTPIQFEVGTICSYMYGTGASPTSIGHVFKGADGATYNMYGIRRRFLVPWIHNYVIDDCDGPNARH